MLISLGVDFRQSNVDARERLLGPFQRIVAADTAALDIPEILSIQTCNRMELYAWSPWAERVGAETVFGDLTESLTESRCVRDEMLLLGHARSGPDVVRHVFRVASGLESQVLGDIHVLGQLRRAYVRATERGTVGPHLHRLFDMALRTGKRVRRETSLMEGRRSVGSEAAHLCLQRLDVPGRRPRVLLVGCGKIGSHAARAIADEPVELLLMNRTAERADALARDLGCYTRPWSDLDRACRDADAVIVATGSDGHVVTRKTFDGDGPLMELRKRIVVDLAVPRNVAPDVGRIPGMQLIDIDALDPRIAEVEEARVASVDDAEGIVDEEMHLFGDWLDARRAGSALEPLRAKLLEVCEREVAFATDEGSAARTASRIVAKMMAAPMEEMRDLVRRGAPVEPVADMMRSLFPQADA